MKKIYPGDIIFYGLIFILGILAMVFSWPIFLGGFFLVLFCVLAWFFLAPILIFLPAFFPFQPALNPSSDFDLASGRVIILLLFLVAIFLVTWKKIKWFNLSRITLLVIFFLAWSFFSVLASHDAERFLRKILVFFSIFPLYFLLLAFLKKSSQWKKLFNYWSLSALVVSIIGLAQFLSQFIFGRDLFFKFWGKIVAPVLYGTNAGEAVVSNPSWFVGTGAGDLLRAISTFPDPHMLAFYLGMSLPIQVYFILRNQKSKIFWLIPGLSLAVILLTFSRGSYVGLIGVFGWILINLPNSTKIRGYLFKTLLVGFLAIFLAFFVAPIRERFLSILDFGEGSNSGRLEIWAESLEVIKNNPFLGVGLGNYAFAVRPESKIREPIYAHNTYLDLASEEGIIGAFSWILILLFGLKPLFKKGSLSDKISLDTFVALSILWFSLHCLFETPIFSPQILPLILVLMAFRAFSEENKAESP